jgi:excisionase family DNA binding protein
MTQQRRVPAQEDEGGLAVGKILLTVPEAAATLAISRSKLYELLAAGSIRSVRIDGSRRVPVEALEAYVAGLLDQEALAHAPAS